MGESLKVRPHSLVELLPLFRMTFETDVEFSLVREEDVPGLARQELYPNSSIQPNF